MISKLKSLNAVSDTSVVNENKNVTPLNIVKPVGIALKANNSFFDEKLSIVSDGIFPNPYTTTKKTNSSFLYAKRILNPSRITFSIFAFPLLVF